MNNSHLALWNQALSLLAARLSPDAFRRWIAPLRAECLQGDAMVLIAPNDFFQSWLQDNYLPLIRAALQEAAGQPLLVRLLCASEGAAASPTAPAPPPPSLDPRPRRGADAELNPSYTFENFVVGQNNQFAHAAALAVAQQPGTAYNPLFIYGGTGLGKTHLMQAVGSSLLRSSRPLRVVYVSAEQFTNDFIEAAKVKNFARFRKKYRTADALLIDDVHFLAGKEATQEEFFHTFNQIYNLRKQIVLSSDRPATAMKSLEQRLVSRFEWGSVVELLPPDFETRVAILRLKAPSHGVHLPDEVINFLAENIRSNVRRLEGALIRVCSFVSLSQRAPSPEELESLLYELILEEGRSSVSIAKIQKIVSSHFDISLSDMTNRRRPREIAFPRQVAMFLCRRLTPASLSDIGASFGGRDHGTVLHACRLILRRMSKDAGLRQTIALLTKQLRQ